MNNTPKPKPVDIDSIIDKVSKLPIPDKDKIDLLTNFKQNMMLPSLGEDENIYRIQQKYSNPYTMQPMQQPIQQPMQQPMQQPSGMGMQQPSAGMGMGMQQPSAGMGMGMQQPSAGMGMGMNMMGVGVNQLMTVAHFDVLKNKMDTIQMELIDLLRHIKDYTQRYMTATRQTDMEKIDEYIQGLFDVDKKMRDIKEQQSVIEEADVEPGEEETVDDAKQGVLTRATNGIKNFFGNIGNNVSSVAGLVSDTANAANGFLSKPLLGKSEEEKNKEKAEAEKASSNKNIVSVNDYVSSNMNSVEGITTNQKEKEKEKEKQPSPTPNIISSNSNTVNQLPNQQTNQPVQVKEPEQPSESIGDEDKELTQAINQLNDKMNQEIDNTVSRGSEQSKQDDTIQTGGGKHANRLTRKIQLLRLKLTEKRLEKHLADATKTHKKHNTHNLRKRKNKKTVKK
jgi:hypothetical protein